MMFGPAHTMHTYRDLSSQIQNPMLRFQSQFGTSAAKQAGTNQLALVGIAAGAINLLYASAIVAPVLAEAAPVVAGLAARGGAALSTAGSTVVRVVGNELALASFALRSAGSSALVFYLHNPILVNQIGLFTTELILSVEGDVPGLLKACAEDPVQAAQIFMQIWVLHASVRTPTGQNYDATLEVQPLPPASQQGNSLKFKTVSVKTTPVAEPAPAPKPQIGSQPPTASTPAPAPKLAVVPGGGQASGTPKGMLRDVDRPGRGVDVPASHPVLKGNVPANDPPPGPQGQRMKVAANAPKDVPAGQVVETAPPASIGQRRDQPAQATTKKPPPGGGKRLPSATPRKKSAPPADELDPGEGEIARGSKRQQNLVSTPGKVPIKDSAWLNGRLPNIEDQREFLKWIEAGHYGEHPHLKPYDPFADGLLEEWNQTLSRPRQLGPRRG